MTTLRPARTALAFFHIATIGTYADVAAEMFARFAASGLLDRVDELRVGIVGRGEVVVPDHPKIRVLFRHPDVRQYEFPTLEALYEAAISNPAPADLLYVHTKGVSVDPCAVGPVTDWRRYMSHFAVDRHAECIDALRSADAVGVDLRDRPRPHFAGNFWWARSEYVAALPPAATMREPDFGDVRFNAEFWVGRGPNARLTSLFESGIAVYERYARRLPERLYRGRSSLPLTFTAWRATKRRLRPIYRGYVRQAGIRGRLAALRCLPVRSDRLGPPRGTTTAKASAGTADPDGGNRYEPVHAAHTAPVLPAVTAQPARHPVFGRSRLAFPETFVLTLPRGRAWGKDGAVITADDRLVDEVSQFFPNQERLRGRHPIFSEYRLGPVTEVDGTVAVLTTLASDFYSHWLLDLFPRTELLRRAGVIDGGSGHVDHVYMPRPRHAYQFRALAAVGIDPSRVIDCQDVRHLRARRLIVPAHVGGVFGAPRWALDFVRSRFLPQGEAAGGRRRLYVSRAGTNHRHVLNEREVLRLLAPLGFEAVRPEALPIDEQASLYASAEAVVGPLGSAMANLAFCRPGTKVVEFFSPHCVQDCTWLLCSQLGLEYHYFVAESGGGDLVPGISDDIVVPADALRRAVERLGLPAR
ncbi:MAG TPA: glycosyltransferase family 61 protein, partial [Humisphaera sp.]